MTKLNIVLYAGKKFGNLVLEYLIKKGISFSIVPNLDDNGKDKEIHKSTIKLAKKNSIKILNNLKLSNLIKKKKLKIDYIICAGTTNIIPKDLLDVIKYGAINFHPSLLPKYRGRYSTVHALFNGEKYSGVTCHWVSNKIDKGAIIEQKKIKIANHFTAKDLYEVFTIEAFKIFKKIFTKILKGEKIKAVQIKVRTKYKNKHFPNNGNLNWNWNGKKILNFIRSMTYAPYEPPSFRLGGKKFYIVEDKLVNKNFIKTSK